MSISIERKIETIKGKVIQGSCSHSEVSYQFGKAIAEYQVEEDLGDTVLKKSTKNIIDENHVLKDVMLCEGASFINGLVDGFEDMGIYQGSELYTLLYEHTLSILS